MASNALKKITSRAKSIRRAHPGVSWKSAVKKAGAEYRAGTISGVKKKKSRRKISGVKRKSTPKKRTVTRMHKVGSVTQTKAALKRQLKEELGALLVRREDTKGVRKKREISKKAAAKRKMIKALD